MGTDQGDGPPKPGDGKKLDDGKDDGKGKDKAGALDEVMAVAAEPGPAAPVAAEVAADEGAGTLPEARAVKIPEDTGKKAAEPAKAAAPASRPSQPALRDSLPAIGDDVPMSFPDDGPTSRSLRKVDHWFGVVEQVTLFSLLAVVVLSGAFEGLASKLAGRSFPWTHELITKGVLSIAMIGAAFASHQQRHLAMDLVSRRLPPRARLFLRLFLAAVTIFVTAMLTRAGWILFRQVSGEHHANDILPAWLGPSTLPLGGGLIIFHTLIHTMIDVDYLVRGKLPPERARSAH